MADTAHLVDFPTIVIADAATDSGAIDLKMWTLCGIFIPASFSGATISFKASTAIGGTYSAVYDADGALISATATDSAWVALAPTDFALIRFLKVVSASAESGAKTLTLAVRARV